MTPDLVTDFDELAKRNQIAPVTQDFDESKGVAGRVNTLVSSGSPLLQTARTKAAQNSARRGLMNSSIGVQAGEQAVIETATPIANADANLYQQQSLTNQAAKNAAATQNAANAIQAGSAGRSLMEQSRIESQRLGQQQAQFDTSSGLERDRLTQQQAQFDTTTGIERERLAQQAGQFDKEQAQRLDLAKRDARTRKELAQIESTFKRDIQNSANISQAWGTLQEGISRIQNNAELDPETKTQLIQNEMASFQAYSSFWRKVSGGAVDVSDLLNLNIASAGTAPATSQSGQVSNQGQEPRTPGSIYDSAGPGNDGP